MTQSTLRVTLALALASCGAASPAAAQTVSWVSGFGDNANPGSRTAPLLTFAAAVAATDPGGEVDALDPGQGWDDTSGTGDWSPLTLTGSVTLDGHTGNAGYHALGSIVVNAGPTDVVILRNLVLDGSVTPAAVGIQFNSGAALHIEHCVIKGFAQGGVVFAPAASAQLYMSDSRIEQVDTAAVSVAPAVAAQATLVRSFLNSSGIGLAADGNSQVTLVETALQGNGTAISASAQHSQVDINVQGGALTGSSVGVESMASNGNAVVRLNAVAAAGLDTPVRTTGAGEVVRYGASPSDRALCYPGGYTLPAALPELRIGIPATFTPALAQAAGNVIVSVTSGSLPTGMAFVGSRLTGTPTQSGNVTFALSVVDPQGCSATASYAASIPEADFTLLAVDGAVSTEGTQAVNANLLLMPVNGVLPDDITFSCSGSTGVACGFDVDPAHLALGGTPVVLTLTPGTLFASRGASGLPLGLLAFGACLGLRDRRRAGRRLLILLALGLTACDASVTNTSTSGGTTGGASTGGTPGGGSTGGTSARPSREVTVTVTATSAGQILRTADVRLTVH